MSQIMEVERIEQGDWNTADSKNRKYVRLIGRDLKGRFVKAVCFSPLAESIISTMQRHLQPGEDVASHRFMMTLEGEWKSKKREGRPGSDRAFMFDRFAIMTGPSVVLNRALKDGTVSLNQAAAFLKAGSLPDAYRVLEKFVAEMTSQPAPSIDHDEIFDSLEDEQSDDVAYEPGNSPEDLAIRRIEAQDARALATKPGAAAETVFGNLESGKTVEAELVDESEIEAAGLSGPQAADDTAEAAVDAGAPSESVEDAAAVVAEPAVDAEASAPDQAIEQAPAAEKTVDRPALQRPPGLPATAKPVEDADEQPAQPSRPAPIPRGGFGNSFGGSFKPFSPGR